MFALIDLTQVEKFLVDQRREIAPSRGDFWRKMKVQNPEELMKVLLDNPSAKSQLNSSIEQGIISVSELDNWIEDQNIFPLEITL